MALGLRLGLGCVGGVVSDFEAVLAVCRFFLKIFQEKSNFFAKTFAQFKKSTYLCIAFQRKSGSKQSRKQLAANRKLRALSSAGSERLPYKQRVGGSNPSAPTH